MLKKFFALLGLVLIIALNFSVTNAAPVASVRDKCKLLTAQEIDSLTKKIQRVEQAHNIKIGISFVKSVGKRDIISAADEMRDKHFLGAQNGSIVLLVDMNQRKYEMATDPTMQAKITDLEGIPYLKNSFQYLLSDGDYYGACNNFIDGVEELVTYYEVNGAAYDPSSEFDPVAAGGAVIVAIFCGIFIRSVLIGSMSNVHHALEAIDYLKKNSVKITENSDMFLFRNVKRRPRSSGGGSRGGRGGGHSSGGGGGGSF